MEDSQASTAPVITAPSPERKPQGPILVALIVVLLLAAFLAGMELGRAPIKFEAIDQTFFQCPIAVRGGGPCGLWVRQNGFRDETKKGESTVQRFNFFICGEGHLTKAPAL